jgi:WD40 repeat protein
MRLHACVKKHANGSRFLPGRVTTAHRNGTIDVECEGGVVKNGLTYEDILIGLPEGQEVEARRPVVMPMQCTSISWSCNGSMVVASYGNPSGSGWCDSPGAVCTWSLFSRDFKPTNPDYVLDHPVCIMCVKCHPHNPSLIAAGSFNGEVIVWDVNSPESPIQVSPIVVESHEDPVMSVDWVYDPSVSAYVVASLGADGKVSHPSSVLA